MLTCRDYFTHEILLYIYLEKVKHKSQNIFLEHFITFLTNIYEGFPIKETFFQKIRLQQIHSCKETGNMRKSSGDMMELTISICAQEKVKGAI